jgi:hypothetical protein
MSETKEINFFTSDKRFKKGMKHYEKFFKNYSANKKALGEATPGYICHPEAPARIKKYLSNAKLILTVRDPITRAYSQYWDNRRKLNESKTFEEAIDLYLDDSWSPSKKGYFSRGIYIKYIRLYLTHFQPEQILVLLFEDLLENPHKFYKKVFKFLNVEPEFKTKDMVRAYNPASIWRNRFYRFFFANPQYQKFLFRKIKRYLFWGKKVFYKYPEMSLTAKRTLTEFYEPWNRELSKFLGRDLSMWN